MRFLFCSDPLQPRRPDEAYAAEVAAVEGAGAGFDLVHFEAFCHELPSSYPAIEGQTPRTVWMRTGIDVSMDAVMELLRPFGPAPVVVKDFVKSRKHEWEEACFIPSAADREAVERVVRRFLELQGNDLSEGLVFREFVPLAPLGTHTLSGMPLAQEYRTFILDGEPVCTVEYWEEGAYDGSEPPLDQFRDVIAAVPSRFFTMDLAQRQDGSWTIVELGDGQVAGLPERADPLRFYEGLVGRLASAPPDASLS